MWNRNVCHFKDYINKLGCDLFSNKANKDLGIYTTNVSQINMAYIPSLLIFLMENADSTRIYVYIYI